MLQGLGGAWCPAQGPPQSWHGHQSSAQSHVTWILASDWSILITWPGYWPLIGQPGVSSGHRGQCQLTHYTGSPASQRKYLDNGKLENLSCFQDHVLLLTCILMFCLHMSFKSLSSCSLKITFVTRVFLLHWEVWHIVSSNFMLTLNDFENWSL